MKIYLVRTVSPCAAALLLPPLPRYRHSFHHILFIIINFNQGRVCLLIHPILPFSPSFKFAGESFAKETETAAEALPYHTTHHQYCRKHMWEMCRTLLVNKCHSNYYYLLFFFLLLAPPLLLLLYPFGGGCVFNIITIRRFRLLIIIIVRHHRRGESESSQPANSTTHSPNEEEGEKKQEFR